MATYQLLPTSSTLHSHQSQAPVQQRKALSFTILILMVATATLITIIRFTVNPNLNGQTFVQPTNAFAIHRAQMLAVKHQQQQQQQQQQLDNLHQKRPLLVDSSTSDRQPDQPGKQIQ
ncbi:hypothetical protein BLA29_012560, partial [Euroglyphus maynei]